MKYVQQRMDNYDKSVKLNDQLCLCYSAKKLKEIESDDVEIIGEVIKGDSKKEESAKLSIENKLISVYDEGTFNKYLYKKTCYIAVEDTDGYIVVMESRLPFLLWLLALLLIAAISLMLLTNSPKPDAVEPYNALPPIDSNVVAVKEETTTHQSEAPEGGGKVGIGYDGNANLNLATRELRLEYKNSSVSNHDAMVEVYIISEGKEYLIAASGRIPVGTALNKVVLSDQAPRLSEGVYNAMYRVYFYDSETGEKSLASSDIKDISLIVKNK